MFALSAAATCGAQDPANDRPPPHVNLRTRQTEYVGPAGEWSTPEAHDEIRIGYFGPQDPDDPLYGGMWQAAQQAIEEANQEGGLDGKPFRLLSAWSVDPWGTGVKQVTELVYRDRVWALVGGVDGPTTHLAEQVVVKARLALVSPVSTDKTVNLANVPWMFSLAPGDHLIAQVLADEIVRRNPHGNLALITGNDHDSFLLTREIRQALSARRRAPRFQFEYAPQSQALAALVSECVVTNPDCVVVVADASLSAQLVLALRAAGFRGGIVGGPACGRDAFVRQVGDQAGGLTLPRLCGQPARSEATAIRAGDKGVLEHSDYAARQTYDAVWLVVRAIRQAGLNRADIAQAIRALSPTAGVSGPIEWDGLGSNVRRPTLASLRGNQVVCLEAPFE